MKPKHTTLAKALGISDRMLRTYFERGCPDTSAAAAKKWQSKNIRPRGDGSVNDELARLRRAQASGAELELAQKHGQLLDVEDVQQVCLAAMVTCSTQLDGLSSRCAAILAGMADPAEIRAYLLTETRSIRNAIAQEFEKLAIQADARPGNAAAEQDAGSVGRPMQKAA